MIITDVFTSLISLTNLVPTDNPSLIENIKEVQLQENTIYNRNKELFYELNSYSKLENNWDGYNGVPPNKNIIDTAIYFLYLLEENCNSPEVMLSGLGEISFYWKEKEKYIEVIFDTPNNYTFFYQISDEILGKDDIYIEKLDNNLKTALTYFSKIVSFNNYALIKSQSPTSINYLEVY